MLTKKFVPDSLYTDYMPRDLNFEDFCYRAAVQKKCLHSYAHPDRYDVWFNMTFLPLWPDNGNLYYFSPVSGGPLGSMVTGNQTVNGVKYYFDPVTGVGTRQ